MGHKAVLLHLPPSHARGGPLLALHTAVRNRLLKGLDLLVRHVVVGDPETLQTGAAEQRRDVLDIVVRQVQVDQTGLARQRRDVRDVLLEQLDVFEVVQLRQGRAFLCLFYV